MAKRGLLLALFGTIFENIRRENSAPFLIFFGVFFLIS